MKPETYPPRVAADKTRWMQRTEPGRWTLAGSYGSRGQQAAALIDESPFCTVAPTVYAVPDAIADMLRGKRGGLNGSALIESDGAAPGAVVVFWDRRGRGLYAAPGFEGYGDIDPKPWRPFRPFGTRHA